MNRSNIEAGQPEQQNNNEPTAQNEQVSQPIANTNVACRTVKVSDVFSFRYNEEETKKRFEPYHCFDGTLIVRERKDGKIYLEDTFWGGSENRTFTLEDAEKQGYLSFICNLDDVEPVDKYQQQYYGDEDFISLYVHHGYRNQYYLRKGAQRSKEKMLQSIKTKIEEAEHKKSSAEWDIKKHTETLSKIESGDLSVYL